MIGTQHTVALLTSARTQGAPDLSLVMAAKGLGKELALHQMLVYVTADDKAVRYVSEGAGTARLPLIEFSPALHTEEHAQLYGAHGQWVTGSVCTGLAGPGYLRSMLHSVRLVIFLGEYQALAEAVDLVANGTTLLVITEDIRRDVSAALEEFLTGRDIVLIVAESLPTAIRNMI